MADIKNGQPYIKDEIDPSLMVYHKQETYHGS